MYYIIENEESVYFGSDTGNLSVMETFKEKYNLNFTFTNDTIHGDKWILKTRYSNRRYSSIISRY